MGVLACLPLGLAIVPSFIGRFVIAVSAWLPDNPRIISLKPAAMTQPVFFAHANGFPSATYGKLFAALAPDYQVLHLPQHGHDPRFPVNDNWSNLVDELLHHLEQRGEPVWGVGHSLGGVLHYHAALLRPELYLGVVMLDSPVLTLADRLVIRAAKRFGFIDRITPAGRTLGRREEFADLSEARSYFAAKSLFRRFDPECLDAYLQHGLHGNGQSLRLRFDPATEISIYRSVPHTTPGRPQQLQVPLAMIRGRHSRVVLAHHARLIRRMARGEYLTLPGGHMFPLERPQDTAELLRSLFRRWSAQAPTEVCA
ncbi:Alpha/beta hydrolase family protein [compost metagenome]